MLVIVSVFLRLLSELKIYKIPYTILVRKNGHILHNCILRNIKELIEAVLTITLGKVCVIGWIKFIFN